MAASPGRPCHIPSCHNLRPCSAHPDRKPWSTKRVDRTVSGWEWQRAVRRVLERDGGLCQLRLPGCLVIATTADHIIGMAEGGSDDDSNLQASCSHCNEAKRREQSRVGRLRRR